MREWGGGGGLTAYSSAKQQVAAVRGGGSYRCIPQKCSPSFCLRLF